MNAISMSKQFRKDLKLLRQASRILPPSKKEQLLLQFVTKYGMTVIDYGPHDCFYHIVEIGGEYESNN